MSDPRLREELPAAEPGEPGLEAAYRGRVRALAERRLTGIERASHAAGLAIALAMAALFVVKLGHLGRGARPVQWAGVGLGLAFSAGWVAAMAAVLRSGVDRFSTNVATRTVLIVAFTGLLAGLMLWAGLDTPDPARGNQLILFGLVFWCATGLPFLVAHLVRQAELRVRAEVLRLELAVARGAARSGERP